MRRLLTLAAVVLVLAGCAPAAQEGVEWIERDKAASLTVSGMDWLFDPGENPAFGVIFVAEGFDLELVTTDVCWFVEETVVRCDLGNVSSPTVVQLAGTDIIAAANYRRGTGNNVYTVFYRKE